MLRTLITGGGLLLALSATSAYAGPAHPSPFLCGFVFAANTQCAIQITHGNHNKARTTQNSTAKYSLQYSSTIQEGNGNFADTHQKGADQAAVTVQYGNNNSSVTYQEGTLNVSVTGQIGSGNWSGTSSIGDGTVTAVYQDNSTP